MTGVPTNAGSSGTAGRCGAPTRRSFRSEHRKEDHVPDVGPVGEEHDQPVDAEPDPAGGGHAVLEGAEVVLVDLMGFAIAPLPEPGLFLEAAPLLVGIVELGEGVRDFAPLDEQLPPLHAILTVPLALRE